MIPSITLPPQGQYQKFSICPWGLTVTWKMFMGFFRNYIFFSLHHLQILLYNNFTFMKLSAVVNASQSNLLLLLQAKLISKCQKAHSSQLLVCILIPARWFDIYSSDPSAGTPCCTTQGLLLHLNC